MVRDITYNYFVGRTIAHVAALLLGLMELMACAAIVPASASTGTTYTATLNGSSEFASGDGLVSSTGSTQYSICRSWWRSCFNG